MDKNTGISLSTIAFTHSLQTITSNRDIAVNSVDARGLMPSWLRTNGGESTEFFR